MNVPSNWFESFFEGVVVDMWVQAVPPEHTVREADSVARMLGVPAGASVLDVPCGAGRVALSLAERGYRMTAVDSSAEFLARARSSAGAEQVVWEKRDMRDLPWPGAFDGAFCVGNSFGYLDDEGNAAFLRAVRAALRPGARFVLETPMILENLLGHLQPNPWWKAGDVYLLVENRYDHERSRVDIEYTFVANGRVEVRRGSHRAYTYRELVDLLTASGFAVTVDQPWTRDAHVVSFIATAV
jgi:SAM-dependent methyltransferase